HTQPEENQRAEVGESKASKKEEAKGIFLRSCSPMGPLCQQELMLVATDQPKGPQALHDNSDDFRMGNHSHLTMSLSLFPWQM
ncbi:hypothetical protein ACQP3C_29970, partial [Escherichia coli]